LFFSTIFCRSTCQINADRSLSATLIITVSSFAMKALRRRHGRRGAARARPPHQSTTGRLISSVRARSCAKPLWARPERWRGCGARISRRSAWPFPDV